LTAVSCACHFAHGEITDDWPQIATDELESESDGIAHLDAFGFRSYIPALMLSVRNHYESSSMRVVGTLGGLCPKKDNSCEYKMNRYSFVDEREAARGYQVSTREPWDKKQPVMISKDAAPIISFPMKNPTIGTVNTA
jgi:hypothetical protein